MPVVSGSETTLPEITVLLVPADGPVQARQIEPTLEVLQALVGGPIELIDLGHGLYAYVNEEGKLDGLRVNHAANEIARQRNAAAYRWGDVLVGSMVIVGPIDGEGDDTSVPSDVVEALTGFEARPTGQVDALFGATRRIGHECS